MSPGLALFLVSPAAAITWVVDPDGGGDAVTLEEGIALLSDYDTLEVREGVYAEGELRVSAEHVTIRGEGWETTVIDGATYGLGVGLYLGSGRLEGISVRNFVDPGAVNYGGGDYPTVTTDALLEVVDCAFIDSGFGVATSYSGALSVQRSRFYGNTWGIIVYHAIGELWVQDSVFVGLNERPAIANDPLEEDDFGPFGELVVISNNLFIAGDVNISASEPYYAMSGPITYLLNNQFTGIYDGVNIGELVTGVVAGNVMGAELGTTLDIDSPDVRAFHNTSGDPDFYAWSDDGDWSNDDFRLRAGSPGVDQGVTGFDHLLTTLDLAGNTRPQDGDGDGTALPDAGPYERLPDAVDPERTDDTGTSADSGTTTTDSGADGGGGDGGSGDDGGAVIGVDEDDRRRCGCGSKGQGAMVGLLVWGLGVRRRRGSSMR